MTDLASLLIKVDSTQAAKAAGDLDKLSTAGKKTEGTINKMTAEQFRAVKAIEAFALATGKLPAALDKVDKSAGRMRAGMQQLSFQIGDVSQQLAMGVSPMRVFAQQGGQIVQAFQVMGGAGNKFLSFLGGPWGVAIAAATVVLIPLISKLLDGRDAIGKLVDEMKKEAEATRQSAEAQKIFDRTVEGSILKIRELTEALKDQNKTLEDTISLNKAAAAGALANIGSNISSVSADLAKAAAEQRAAERELEKLSSGQLFGVDDPASAMVAAQSQVDAARTRVAELTRQLEALSAAANQGAAALRSVDFPLFERNAREAVDPIARINRQYDDMAKKAKAAAAGNDALKASLQATLTQIERTREAALKAERDKAKPGQALTNFISPVSGGRITGAFGEQRPGGQHKGVDIAVPVGTPVKAPAAGVIVEAGTLPGYGNVVFIDHGGGTITRLAHLSRISVSRGQEIAQGGVIGLSGGASGAPGSGNSKGPHVHLETLVGGRQVNPLTGRFRTDQATASIRAAEAAQKLAEQALDRQQAFESESGKLDAEILRAKGQLAQGTDAEADFAIKQIQIEQANYEAALDRAVAGKKIEAIDAQALKIKHAGLTFEKAKAIETRRQLERMKRESEAAQRQFQNQIDDLRFTDEMVTTASEHREVQLKILDIAYQQKEAALRDLKARLMLAGQLEEAALVQGQIDRLPTEKAQDRERAKRGTMNPLEQWAASIPKTEAEITEAFQRIQVNAFEGLTNAITGVIMGTQSLKEAFGDLARSIIADIIQMTIRMLIFKAISGIMGGFGGGGGGGTDLGAIYAGGGIGSAKGNIFSGGNLIPFARGGIVNGPTMFPMNGGRTGIMGEAGPEAVMPLARDGQGRLGVRAANSNDGPIEVVVVLDASPDLLVKSAAVADSVYRRNEPGTIKRAANVTLRVANRPMLMGRR